jgi:hypothetical protein
MKLYPKDQRTLPPQDYAALMEEARRLGAKRVLEFGPGYSTYAFIEQGVDEIVGLEYLPEWFEKQEERFKSYPQVKVDWFWDEAPEARVPDGLGSFDLALVDSPKGYLGARKVHPGMEDCSRLNTCLAALHLAPIVLLHDASRGLERATLSRLEQLGHSVEFIAWPASGKWKSPDSYGIARITRDGKKPQRPDLPIAS